MMHELQLLQPGCRPTSWRVQLTNKRFSEWINYVNHSMQLGPVISAVRETTEM